MTISGFKNLINKGVKKEQLPQLPMTKIEEFT